MSRGAVIEVVTVPASDLEALIHRAVAKALADRGVTADADLMSATRAARLIHRRTADVLAALEDGSLRGKRRGRRWMVSATAARAWAQRGAQ